MTVSALTPHHLLRTQVYEHLREQLRLEELAPGMFISINQLMKSLGISRTPLRDALLQLQNEGFVTFLPQRGIRINELTPKDVENLYEMLGALDSRAMLSVFDRIPPEAIMRMKQVNEEMIAADCSQGFGQYFNLNTRFHTVYLELSTNRELLNQLNIIRARLFEFGKKDWGKIHQLNYTEHLTLIDLIERGRAREAAEFIRDVHCVLNL